MGDEWDAGAYQRVSEPQLAWGRLVVERIPLDGDERAIDAGCGTGRVTRLLAERLPRGYGARRWTARRAWWRRRRGSSRTSVTG